ncbi:2OG-Fe(II) oxygenase [Synechococcus sp. 1G10]|uniref:2OG-Fe(II) oxygenase n=1 Tax=Synechococcus sp. 1G10 TaxID=2025605 RepID=UPI000B9841D1|nr:2OG-Fe(II) oxygenase [Synechococcus sp. 1G10]
MLKLLSTEFLQSTEELSRSFRENSPCPHISIDNLLDHDFCRRLISEFPPCDPSVLERFQANGMRGGKTKNQKVRDLGESFRAFDDLVQSKEFLDLLTRITGIPNLLYDPEYYGGGTHESLNGERLLPHIDYNYHPTAGWYRRLNLLVYLNPDWQDEWGGRLELHSDPLHPDRDQIVRCPNGMNSCTLLETTSSSWHGFPVIELPPGKRHLTRRSVAVYYYTLHPPSEDTILNRSTVYVDEPLPSYLKAGHILAEKDILDLREQWQMRSNHSRELLEEIVLHGYQFLYHLEAGCEVSEQDSQRMHGTYQAIERLIDKLERVHLGLRNPDKAEDTSRASWLREAPNEAPLD